jgi:hypothetical protein
MGREVRKVRGDWVHPKKPSGAFRPLCEGYESAAKAWTESLQEKGLQETLDHFGDAPNRDDYMPEWTYAEADHLMMYENVSEGTPISPAFKTAEELARWLSDNKANAGFSQKATYEQWLRMIQVGSAPTMVSSFGPSGLKIQTGVEALSDEPGAGAA